MNRGLAGVALAVLVSWGCGGGSPAVMTGSGGAPGGSGGNPSGTGGAGGTTPDAGTGGGSGGATDGGGGDRGGTGGSGGAAGSDGGGDTTTDTGPEGDPTLLSQTGLYANIAQGTLAPGVFAFQPQYPLWSDSSTKRRWVSLPAGTKIDTSDMDFWDYPSGIKFWKEFTRNDAAGQPVRVETRLLTKRAAGVWFAMAFKWNAQQTEAMAVPMGEKNASGTQHDIPTKENCSTCHSAMWDFALGFSALQLSHSLPGSLNLEQVKTMGWLSNPPAATSFTLPGDNVDKAALGYMHANCGMCHNERSKIYNINVDMDLWTHLDIASSVNTTRAYLSTVCDEWSRNTIITTCAAGHAVGAASKGMTARVPKRITPGMPAVSGVHELMALREMGVVGMRQMPPLGTKIVDPAGLAAVDAWITRLQRQ